MKSVIICEGGSDLALIQYFMEKTNNWAYTNSNKEIRYFKNVKNFKKEDRMLTVASAGGCSKILKCFEGVIEKNRYSTSEEEMFNNIIIISDRDEINTVEDFESKIKDILNDIVEIDDIDINNDEWINISCLNGRQIEINFNILLLIIPFEETGAIETFLLNAISKKDFYDKDMIDEINTFVENIDSEERYLRKRRHKTKAKFDVYFSIRTPLEQFVERRNILKSIPWEEYEEIQNSFKKLNQI